MFVLLHIIKASPYCFTGSNTEFVCGHESARVLLDDRTAAGTAYPLSMCFEAHDTSFIEVYTLGLTAEHEYTIVSNFCIIYHGKPL